MIDGPSFLFYSITQYIQFPGRNSCRLPTEKEYVGLRLDAVRVIRSKTQ